MHENIKKQIRQRLSLRKPQSDALEAASRFVESVGLQKEYNLPDALQKARAEFPQLKEFEREFANVCLALATGVGKTRLMSALISYLVEAYNIRHFMILAPNRTILEKLEREFSDPNDRKYVFNGLRDLGSRVRIINTDNFDEGEGVRNDRKKQHEIFSQNEIHINVFNIAMIHANNDIGRRIKKGNDYIPEGYFDYLTKLDDLVILMDEAHRYRAKGAMQAINDLKPILGIELTATPYIEKGEKKMDFFKNVIFEYALADAIRDGLVKEPEVAGRENFKHTDYDTDTLEDLKIKDAISIHEQTKLHLLLYAARENVPVIKPFILIIAQDTTHANRIRAKIESPDFLEGHYQSKVTTVHSKQEGEEEERMVRELLSIENKDNSTEIVIHVNMLREGWDVVNLYTIVPLRTANSKTLIEQQIGRGLRLPYGKRTGVKEIDRLTIVSHDRFNEIVDEANKSDSIIRSGWFIDREIPKEGQYIREILPKAECGYLELIPEEDRNVIRKVVDFINTSPNHYTDTDIQKKIQTCAQETGVIIEKAEKYVSTVKELRELTSGLTIEIPRITVQPELIQSSYYRPFKLDLQQYTPQPIDERILHQSLATGARTYTGISNVLERDDSVAESVISAIIDDWNEIASTEENQKIAIDLADQVVTHLQSYLKEEDKVANVWFHHKKQLLPVIRRQLGLHYEPPKQAYSRSANEYETYPKRTKKELVKKGQEPVDFRIPLERKSAIREMIFTGFAKSLYTEIVFDSDPERCFAIILDNAQSVRKWLKANDGEVRYILYHKDERYHPDFVVETDDHMYLCEIKRRVDINTPIVEQKAHAALEWCDEATRLAIQNKKKPWSYLLIPHDEVEVNMTFEGLAAKYLRKI